jgi:hypothetical protein
VRHGRRLEYLAFPNVYPEMLEPEDMEDFGPLLHLCPSLTHVVLPAYAVVSGTYTFPTVKWLDHWCLRIHTTPHTGGDVLLAFPALLGYRLLDVALSVHIADVPGTFDPCARGAWTITFPGMAIEQAQDGPDGVPRLMLGDLSAVADWDISYFGAMETNTVQREQEYFDLGWGKLQHFPFPPPMPLVFDDPIGHEIDPDEPRLDRDACRNIPAPYHLQWLQDETDDEESDLESEDVGDLDDEFYQETEPIPDPVLPQWAHPPASISTRGSFPWLSSALQSTLFGPFIS